MDGIGLMSVSEIDIDDVGSSVLPDVEAVDISELYKYCKVMSNVLYDHI